jgi:hypothetical protein
MSNPEPPLGRGSCGETIDENGCNFPTLSYLGKDEAPNPSDVNDHRLCNVLIDTNSVFVLSLSTYLGIASNVPDRFRFFDGLLSEIHLTADHNTTVQKESALTAN